MRQLTTRLASRWAVLPLAVALLLATGCRKPRKFVRTQQQQAVVNAAILTEAPKVQFKVDANLADKIRLIGADIEPNKKLSGGKVTVHFYWECLKPIGDKGDWMIFVHAEGPVNGGGMGRVIADHHAVEDSKGGPGLFPISEWQVGQIIKDTKTFNLVDPRGRKVGPGPVVLYAGVFDMEAHLKNQKDIRLQVINKDKVKQDDNFRIEVARFAVGDGPPQAPRVPFRAPEMHVRKAISPIVIDGKLDETAWRAAVSSPAFKRPDGTQANSSMHTRVKLLWDDEALYVGFQVRDKAPTSKFTKRDEELWRSDVVEVYLDPGADMKNYVELQVSPKNIIFDALFKERRKPDWKDARSWNLRGMKSAVQAGILPGRAKHQGWTVEIAVPWSGLADAQGAKPKPNTRWKANFFRIDAPGDFNHLVSWSSVSDDRRPDFHNLKRAGYLIFVETPELVRKRVLGIKTVPQKEATPTPKKPAKTPKKPAKTPKKPAKTPKKPAKAKGK
ncbi:MAG TPA: hypothetical protein EYN06_08685 [Myxococcales bacterium]|nr:hypothetical protein [Myxococcales bacterium]HIN86542.1 hypothetical protein [Myxococcales bacterium]